AAGAGAGARCGATAAAAAPASPGAVERRAESGRNGAAAGSRPAPAGRTGGAAGCAGNAACPHLPQRASGSHTRSAEERLRKSRRRDGVLAGPSEEPFVRPATSPRRVLFLLVLTAAGSFADPALAPDI